MFWECSLGAYCRYLWWNSPIAGQNPQDPGSFAHTCRWSPRCTCRNAKIYVGHLFPIPSLIARTDGTHLVVFYRPDPLHVFDEHVGISKPSRANANDHATDVHRPTRELLSDHKMLPASGGSVQHSQSPVAAELGAVIGQTMRAETA